MAHSLYPQPSFGVIFGPIPDLAEGESADQNTTEQLAQLAEPPQNTFRDDQPQDSYEN